MAYKRRNAELDALSASPPAYLANSSKKLANEDFAELSDQKELEEIHAYLSKRHSLLDRVIKARKLHHSHFYALNMDYGHEKFLSSLVTQKLTVLKALSRVVQRTAEVMYQQRKWFEWARQCQDEEDKQRENEQKIIKREAALFRRQAKELHRRMREVKAKEDARRQEQFLEAAYQERLAAEAGQEVWDPLEDVIENERGTYIHMIRYFLWMVDQQTSAEEADRAVPAETSTDDTPNPDMLADNKMDVNTNQMTSEPAEQPSKPQNGKKKNKKKGRGRKSEEPLSTDLIDGSIASNEGENLSPRISKPVIVATGDRNQRPEEEPDMAETESLEEMRSRLLQGTKVAGGRLVFVAVDGKKRVLERMPPMSLSEVDRLTAEIAEIKNYLLCRILLRSAVLLPAAMAADSLEDFLESPELKTQDLRDLCLKLEQPSLQDIRDACADFFRTDDDTVAGDPADNADADDEDSDSDGDVPAVPSGRRRRKHQLPKAWQSKREIAIRSAKTEEQDQMIELFEEMNQSDDYGTRIDFGIIDDSGNLQKSKMRVKICGRYIYNYPSKGSLNRGGWLQFSILARNCSLYKAAELCKSWDEFYELNVLALYFYFPNPEWFSGVSSNFVQRSYIHMVSPILQSSGPAACYIACWHILLCPSRVMNHTDHSVGIHPVQHFPRCGPPQFQSQRTHQCWAACSCFCRGQELGVCTNETQQPDQPTIHTVCVDASTGNDDSGARWKNWSNHCPTT